jgi:glucose/arabinose dehydrogenase
MSTALSRILFSMRNWTIKTAACLLFISLSLLTSAMGQSLKLVPQQISLKNGRTFALNVPEGFDISVAAEGLKRVRFMARSPDNRIFVTDMYSLADNRRGAVYILEDFDARSGRFARVKTYMTRLRNPNSIAFYTDERGTSWFYLALTDRLVRYKYSPGEDTPSGEPDVLATFPDYGLSYKYGGWHLTRTISISNRGKLYVSVGSSCNSCEESEEIRASVLEMDMDGSHRRIFARGLRNAVGLKWVNNQLFATDMGADHLGEDRPEDTMYVVKDSANYGWPYCFQYRSRVYADSQYNPRNFSCKNVPLAYAGFAAHSSPLGLEFFSSGDTDARLRNSFLVALHGSSDLSLRRGYSIARVRKGSAPQDFISGFLQHGKVVGRPADIMQAGANAFFFTDDDAGVVYYVYKK